MFRARLVAFIVVLVGAGCGSADSSSVDDAGADPALPPPGTEIEGFAGSEGAVALLDEIRVRLVEHPGCPVPGSETQDRSAAVADGLAQIPDAGVDAFESAMQGLDDVAGVCAADDERWRQGVVDAIDQLGVFERTVGLAAPPLEIEVDAGLAELAAAAVSRHDRLYGHLSGTTLVMQSPYWYSPAHAENIIELRRLVASDETPSLLLVGNSLAARGVDIASLRAADFDAVGVATPGSSPDVQPPLVEEALAIAPGVTTLIWVVSPDWLFRHCAPNTRFDEVQAARSLVFASVADAAELSSLDLQLGTDPLDSQRDVPSYRVAFRDPTYGMFGPLVGRSENRIARQIELADSMYRGPSGPTLCGDRLDFIETTVQAWVSAGIDVQFMVPPLSDDLLAFHPEGAEGMADAVALMGQRVTGAGGTFHDFSPIVPNDRFYDLHHVDDRGRVTFTAAVLDQLAPA